MNKNIFIQWLRNLKLYRFYCKINRTLHYKPSYHRVKNFIKHYIGGLIDRVDEHHVFLLAGGLAFSLFVCIIPFFLIMFYILGNILSSQSMQVQVNTAIHTIIPYEKYADFVRNIVFKRIVEVVKYKNIAGIVGVFGLLFAASGLFSSMRTILNRVFGLESNIHFLLGKLRDFALVLMVIIIFFILTIVTPALDLIRQIATEWNVLRIFNFGVLDHLIIAVISFIIIFSVFVILYISVPVRKLGRKATAVSAFWAAILWESAKQGFGFYLHHFTTLGRIYGTYAIVVVVAFWIYYSSIVFIIGAEIGRLYTEKKYSSEEMLE